MKKLFALLLIAGLGVSFVGCGGEDPAPPKATDKPTATEPAKPADEGTPPPASTDTTPPAPDATPPAPGPAPAPGEGATPAPEAPK